MTATVSGQSPATGATPPRIKFEVFDREAAKLGAKDETARAELAEVDRTTLWRWRNGKQFPSLDRAARIAARFRVSLDELIEMDA